VRRSIPSLVKLQHVSKAAAAAAFEESVGPIRPRRHCPFVPPVPPLAAAAAAEEEEARTRGRLFSWDTGNEGFEVPQLSFSTKVRSFCGHHLLGSALVPQRA